MLMAIRLWPTTSASLKARGSLAAKFFISSAVGAPAVAPITSAAPPVFAPDGSGFGSGATSTACAGSSAIRNGGVLHKLAKASKIMMNTVFNPFFLFMRESPFMIRVRIRTLINLG